MQFHIVDSPELFPQADVIGDSSEAAGPYVDLNIELERATHLYLGQRVVREIVKLAQPDLCPIAERDAALEDAATARRYKDEAEAANVLLRVQAAAHQRTRDDLINTRASYNALLESYAALEAGGVETAQEKLTRTTKPAPVRKRAAVGLKT
ncbi:MAG TPA: hypothetical protein VIM33_07575 [Gaiellaceae bacterium]|jgi:hypothetical protein